MPHSVAGRARTIWIQEPCPLEGHSLCVRPKGQKLCWGLEWGGFKTPCGGDVRARVPLAVE